MSRLQPCLKRIRLDERITGKVTGKTFSKFKTSLRRSGCLWQQCRRRSHAGVSHEKNVRKESKMKLMGVMSSRSRLAKRK